MTLKIDGMTCGHCQKAVQEALENVPGTQNILVDLQNGIATLESTVPVEQLIAAVVEEGYQASAA
jgi:copper chaperone